MNKLFLGMVFCINFLPLSYAMKPEERFRLVSLKEPYTFLKSSDKTAVQIVVLKKGLKMNNDGKPVNKGLSYVMKGDGDIEGSDYEVICSLENVSLLASGCLIIKEKDGCKIPKQYVETYEEIGEIEWSL